MNIQVKATTSLACAAVLVGALTSFAHAGVTAAAAQAEASLRQTFPKLAVGTVSESPVNGLFEVVSGNNIIYYSPESKHIIFGEMWSHTGTNVTAQAKSKIHAKKLDLFQPALADAVKIGNGPNVVIEITDPDCPFCRKMHAYWQGRSDVTRYVFMMPIASLHPKADAKSRFILSAANQAQAMNDVFSGMYDSQPLPSYKENERLVSVHRELAAKSGIDGTPAYFINGSFVSGANIPLIEQLIKKGALPK